MLGPIDENAPIAPFRIDEVRLKRLEVRLRKRVPRYVLRNARFEKDFDPFTDEMILSLASHVMGETVENQTHTVTFDEPADWWQMWKRDHAPAWFLTRWPVKTRTHHRTVTAEMVATYPQLPMMLPDTGAVRFIAEWRGTNQ